MRRLLVATVLGAVLAACASDAPSVSPFTEAPSTSAADTTSPPATASPLGTWAYDLDRSTIALAELDGMRLTVDRLEVTAEGVAPGEGLRTIGTSPCGDSHDGVVAVDGTAWSHRTFATEDIGCPSEAHRTAEERYETALLHVERGTVEGDVLTLTAGDDRLVYRRVGAVDLARLDGVAWRLTAWADDVRRPVADGSTVLVAFHVEDDDSGVWSLQTPCLDSYGDWTRRGDTLVRTSGQTIGWPDPEQCSDTAQTAMDRARAVDFTVRSVTASTLELGGTQPGDAWATFEAVGPARTSGPPAPASERTCESGGTAYDGDAPWTDPAEALSHFGEELPPGLTLSGEAILLGDAPVGTATPTTFPDGTVAVGAWEWCVAEDRDLSVPWRP